MIFTKLVNRKICHFNTLVPQFPLFPSEIHTLYMKNTKSQKFEKIPHAYVCKKVGNMGNKEKKPSKINALMAFFVGNKKGNNGEQWGTRRNNEEEIR